jgi:sterol desaturase/sphingolipid hydroxylase (fatty acid hydroxylase superfamily)
VWLLKEGVIATYHHANINTPKKMRWISLFIQTPEMHLIHHQKGLHRYNYVTFLWDTVFKTARIPKNWDDELGLNLKNGIQDIFLCKK